MNKFVIVRACRWYGHVFMHLQTPIPVCKKGDIPKIRAKVYHVCRVDLANTRNSCWLIIVMMERPSG